LWEGLLPIGGTGSKNIHWCCKYCTGSVLGVQQVGTRKEDEADLSLLDKKERKKVEAKRKAKAKKAKKRLNREKDWAIEKAIRDVDKAKNKEEGQADKTLTNVASSERHDVPLTAFPSPIARPQK
jgi:predicted nucleotide-binding protein (sugar kinase/HSP70/actin superfamily)